jgi:hypothetical protein
MPAFSADSSSAFLAFVAASLAALRASAAAFRVFSAAFRAASATFLFCSSMIDWIFPCVCVRSLLKLTTRP